MTRAGFVPGKIRGGLVFKDHRLVYHTLNSRLECDKEEEEEDSNRSTVVRGSFGPMHEESEHGCSGPCLGTVWVGTDNPVYSIEIHEINGLVGRNCANLNTRKFQFNGGLSVWSV